MPKMVEDATCVSCGCTCDDITLKVRDNRIVEANNACELGEAWFLDSQTQDRPSCLVAGRPATLEEGYDRAAEILTRAIYPIVSGLSGATCQAQCVAVSIGDWIGACVDTTGSDDHGSASIAMQRVGQVTATLGEVVHRGDLVIFWGSDPAESHPRHFTRYSLMPAGQFVPRGREDRTCVVVDVRKTKSADEADIFVQIEPNKDFEALWTLRALARGLELDSQLVESETGVPLKTWQNLMDQMKRAKYGVIFFGRGLTSTRGRHANCEALFSLVSDMNAHTRFVTLLNRSGGNTAGAENVMAWRTGYALGVNHARGYPRSNPGEYTTADTLTHREADAALIVAGDLMSNLSLSAREHLASIPYVALDSQETPTTRGAAVAVTVGTYGIHTGGTVYRMDDVPISLRPAVDSPHPSAEKVLSEIESRVRKTLGIEPAETP